MGSEMCIRDSLSLIALEVDYEFDDEPSFKIRGAILAARKTDVISDTDWHEPSADELNGLPDCTCTDIDRWQHEIEILADQILWDRDFELEELIADQDPFKVAGIKEYLGIGRDYFSTPGPDANSQEYLKMDRELVEIVKKTNPAVYRLSLIHI